jgi:hypothetical protein
MTLKNSVKVFETVKSVTIQSFMGGKYIQFMVHFSIEYWW